MSFTSEMEMKEVAVESLPNAFGIQSDNVLPEFDYGKGRTDLVLVNISDDYWSHRQERLELSTPISSKQHLISFLEIHGKGLVTENFFLETGAQPRRKKRRSLDWLIKNQFITDVGGGKIRTARNLRRHVTTTIAIELKLSKWKAALKQASMGRSFAEYQYVAVDHDHLNPALQNLEVFRANEVGLISIDQSGEVTIHWDPTRSRPYSDLYQWKINEASAGILSSS